MSDSDFDDAVNDPEVDLDPDTAAIWAAANVLRKHGVDGATYEKLLAIRPMDEYRGQ